MSRQNASSPKPVGTTTTSRLVLITPTNTDLIDAGMVFLLGFLALFEFHTTYAGWDFMGVAMIGLVLGLVIAHLANVLRQPMIVLAAMGVAAFFLLGGAVAVRDVPGAGAIPTGGTLKSLANSAVHDWRDLLTTVPPVDGSGSLLVLPYILGLFCGLGGFALARRTKGAVWPVFAPLAVFAAVILLGTVHPASTELFGSLFAVAALVWTAMRHQRQRPVVSSGSGRGTRLAIGGVLLALAGFGAYLLGPHVPGSESHSRVVLRKYITPPVQIGNYPSPLAEYRGYVGQQDGSLASSVLFKVGGSLPAGTAIRFATLDAYNGNVWTASNTDTTVDGVPNAFLKVGPTLDNPARGRTYKMTVSIGSYNDYWLPAAGAIQAIKFTDSDATSQTDGFRYDLATSTGIVPTTLSSTKSNTDSYTLRVAGVTTPTLTAGDTLAGGAQLDTDAAFAEVLQNAAKALGGQSGNTTDQVLKMAQTLLHDGYYTHGDTKGIEYYLPGHSEKRIQSFVNGVEQGFPPYVGDDEQYAAAFALTIEELGVPARVVVGVPSMPSSGVVTGANVRAWVEVQSAEGGWLQIPSNQFISSTPPPENQLAQKLQQPPGSDLPPPAQGRPKTSLDDSAQADSSSNDLVKKKTTTSHSGGFSLPGWLIDIGQYVGLPLLVLALIGLIIVGCKALRRQRRRTRGSPGARLVLGWREATDSARDLGSVLPPRSTRREQAVALSNADGPALARLADSYVFGGQEITDDNARVFWVEVAKARKSMNSAAGRWHRLRAAVSITTFLPRLPGAES